MRRELDDADLVASVRLGDDEAFGALFARHRGAVHAAVAARLADPEDRRDVVQEAFVRALQRLDTLAEPARFRPWLLQIARNAAADLLRRKRTLQPLSLDAPDAPAPVAADPTPEDLAELADLAARVRTGMALLSQRDATALTLVVRFGFGPRELAAALAITPGNAKVVLHRARRRLRMAIAAEQPMPVV